jgi:predicted transcriptional regulator
VRNRTSVQIMSQILETAMSSSTTRRGVHANGATKTKLVYGAFLTSVQLNHYLRLLTEKGLISYEEASQTFKATEKGCRFVEACNQMHSIMG